MRKIPLIPCPRCGRNIEPVQWSKDFKIIQFECRGCLSYWDMKNTDMNEDDIRGVASE